MGYRKPRALAKLHIEKQITQPIQPLQNTFSTMLLSKWMLWAMQMWPRGGNNRKSERLSYTRHSFQHAFLLQPNSIYRKSHRERIEHSLQCGLGGKETYSWSLSAEISKSWRLTQEQYKVCYKALVEIARLGKLSKVPWGKRLSNKKELQKEGCFSKEHY